MAQIAILCNEINYEHAKTLIFSFEIVNSLSFSKLRFKEQNSFLVCDGPKDWKEVSSLSFYVQYQFCYSVPWSWKIQNWKSNRYNVDTYPLKQPLGQQWSNIQYIIGLCWLCKINVNSLRFMVLFWEIYYGQRLGNVI